MEGRLRSNGDTARIHSNDMFGLSGLACDDDGDNNLYKIRPM